MKVRAETRNLQRISNEVKEDRLRALLSRSRVSFRVEELGLSRTFPSLAHVAAQTPTKQKLREPEIPLLPQKEKKRCRNKGKKKKSEREKS